MSATTSATTGRRYGIQRVCQAWERSRSTHSARRARARRRERGEPARRGPTPAHSDEQLLAAVRADLARSPVQGEGHRKVHARLRILDGIRVARTRVLRVMRAHGLLSPPRGRQGDPQLHDGTIITAAPHVMWGTDGGRVFTVDDGWVWTFAAVDHWNAECVGWHVCKVGNRFAALEPIAHGLRQRYGSVDADVARGLALRMDHGSQALSALPVPPLARSGSARGSPHAMSGRFRGLRQRPYRAQAVPAGGCALFLLEPAQEGHLEGVGPVPCGGRRPPRRGDGAGPRRWAAPR